MKKIINNLLIKGFLPDCIVRWGIRQRLKAKLKSLNANGDIENCKKNLQKHIEGLKNAPIAINTDSANEQHYEIPAEFMQLFMGEHLKYSCCLWDKDTKDLTTAEKNMLELTSKRIGKILPEQNILELGCGWGSMTLYLAKRNPQANFTAISNSSTQKKFIEKRALQENIENIEIITANIADYDNSNFKQKFDKAYSVEMFEHMKNYQLLMRKIADWLKPNGTLFVHIFTHREHAYHYEADNEAEWLSKYFFTGGQMPADSLLLYFQDGFSIVNHWNVNGCHYQKTANAWLENYDANKEKILPIIEKVYQKQNSEKWFNYWRIFFMACAELWGYDKGCEWLVSHYSFTKKYTGSSPFL